MRSRPFSGLQGELIFQAEPTAHDREGAIEKRIIIPSINRDVPAVAHSTAQVAKHNAMAEARYFLSARAQKFVLFAISKIDPKDVELRRMYTIHAAEFAEWAQIGLQSVRRDFWDPPAKQKEVSIGKELLQEVLVIPNYYQPERNRYTDLGTHWFSSVIPENTSGPCGYLDVNFSPRLAPMLLQLRGNYYRINKIAIRKFDSRYTIRLFEWIESWSYLQARVNNRMNITVDALRGILGTDRPLHEVSRKGLGDTKGFIRDGFVYERKLGLYGHFKKVALDIAISEVNRKTDYHVTATPVRRIGSKGICSFDFEVHPKASVVIVSGLNSPKPGKQPKDAGPMLFSFPPGSTDASGVAAPKTITATVEAEMEMMPPGTPWPPRRPRLADGATVKTATALTAVEAEPSTKTDEGLLDAMVGDLVTMYQLHPSQRDLAGYARSVGRCSTPAECMAWLKSIHDGVRRNDQATNPARTFMAMVKGQFSDGRRVKLRPIVNPLAPAKNAPTSAPVPAPALSVAIIEASASSEPEPTDEEKAVKARIKAQAHEFRVQQWGPERAAKWEARQQQESSKRTIQD